MGIRKGHPTKGIKKNLYVTFDNELCEIVSLAKKKWHTYIFNWVRCLLLGLHRGQCRNKQNINPMLQRKTNKTRKLIRQEIQSFWSRRGAVIPQIHTDIVPLDFTPVLFSFLFSDSFQAHLELEWHETTALYVGFLYIS